MAKKSKHKYNEKSRLKNETVQAVVSIACLAIGVFLVLAWIGKAGPVGSATYKALSQALGIGYFLFPTILFLYGIASLKDLHKSVSWIKVASSALFFLAGLSITEILVSGEGGFVGKIISVPFLNLFGSLASLILLGAVLMICALMILDTGININPLIELLKNPIFKKKDGVKIKGAVAPDNEDEKEENDAEEDDDEEEVEDAEEEEREVRINTGAKKPSLEEFSVKEQKFRHTRSVFKPIPLSLLEKDKGTPGVGDIKGNVNIIKRTLQNFGIEVEMDEVTIGPTVTRYALKPAEGVKLSRIVGLQNDLSLALAAHPLRIEAPIPGKSLVGIEVPNSTKSTVGLASMLGDAEFSKSEKPLLVALGKAIAGTGIFGNLSKMPHLLIAGATGSGKSVTIHGIITSLLYRNSPEQMKLIMIDPKRVELTLYNKIPHLLTPVITEAKKAIIALKWAAKEMDRRYDVLEAESVRDIDSYHKNIVMPAMKKLENKELSEEDAQKIPETMPFIVIVIDELADIMATYPRELESAIVRIAQMSRAVGIHLIISTQRPSVNVITGLIKANVPARIALQVSSQIDSRTILDTGGAEKLLGAGDLLYLSGDMSKPSRLQAPFISETEVKKVVRFLIDSYADTLQDQIDFSTSTIDPNIFEATLEESEAEDDDLYEAAHEEVIRAGKASTSYLQRKLSIGYARAARLVDLLEKRGVIGPGHGAKPREVLGSTPSEPSEAEES